LEPSGGEGEDGGQLERSLILKSAMFWDSKSRIERIKSLMLSNLNLEEFDDVEDFKIRELTSIRQLSLSKNRLIHLQPLAILDTLVTLNINHNKVYNLAPLQALTNLEELYASNNQIVNIDSLGLLEKLRILNLYNNKIAHFDSTFAALQKMSLEDLDVEENPFYC
jgi:internalin A